MTVIADSLLRQLFYNLIDDSLKHGEKVSQIRLHYKEGKSGLKLFYEDDGVGIPKAMKSKIFDSAFTAGKGSGYGLPLIKRMVEVYGWQIEEKCEPGKGAKFVITIPMRTDSNQKQRHSNKKAFY
jgi:signal transduction histidine kinase